MFEINFIEISSPFTERAEPLRNDYLRRMATCWAGTAYFCTHQFLRATEASKNNESFNAAVWNLAPKAYSSGKKVLNIATYIAVCNFNDGLKSVLRIMQVLKLEIGTQSYNFCVESDAKRIQYAERALTDAAK